MVEVIPGILEKDWESIEKKIKAKKVVQIIKKHFKL